MEEEVFDIQFFTNRPGHWTICENMQTNEPLQKAIRDCPHDASMEEQKAFFEKHGFKVKVDKFRQVVSDWFTPEELSKMDMKLPTKEEVRYSAFVFDIKKDRKVKQCIKKMPKNLKKKQIADYLRNYGYVVTESIADDMERVFTVTNPVKRKK